MASATGPRTGRHHLAPGALAPTGPLATTAAGALGDPVVCCEPGRQDRHATAAGRCTVAIVQCAYHATDACSAGGARRGGRRLWHAPGGRSAAECALRRGRAYAARVATTESDGAAAAQCAARAGDVSTVAGAARGAHRAAANRRGGAYRSARGDAGRRRAGHNRSAAGRVRRCERHCRPVLPPAAVDDIAVLARQ
eukprot:ctg_1188.g245